MPDLPDSFPITLVDWTDVLSWCSAIHREVRDDGYPVDTIVGIARGGWVPARILADMLSISKTVSLKIEKHTGPGRADASVRLRHGGGAELFNDRNILIVDDSVDTGDTIRTAINYVTEADPTRCRTAACQRYNDTIFGDTADAELVDYAADTVESWKLFLYPWSYTEVMTDAVNGVLVKSSADTFTENDIYELLNEYHGIEQGELERIHSGRMSTLLTEMARDGIIAPVEGEEEDAPQLWWLRTAGVQRYGERTRGE